MEKDNVFRPLALLSKYLYDNVDTKETYLVYHYTKKTIANKIIVDRENCLKFWHMKHKWDKKEFDDEFINRLYLVAIDELKTERRELNWKSIEDVRIDNRFLFSDKGKLEEGEAYICSFSIISPKQDKNAYDRFRKENKEMSCISLHTLNLLEEISHNTCDYSLHYILPLVYGCKQVIQFIKKFLIELFNITDSSTYRKYMAHSFLNICRYSFKPCKYEDEAEIRSVIILDKEYSEFIDKQVEEKNTPHFDAIFGMICLSAVDYEKVK